MIDLGCFLTPMTGGVRSEGLRKSRGGAGEKGGWLGQKERVEIGCNVFWVSDTADTA